MSTYPDITLDGSPMTIDQVVAVARHGASVRLGEAARGAVEAARTIVDDAASGADPVYGINTGFGSLSRHRVDPEQTCQIQLHLLRSHAAGVGEPLEAEVVRGMLVLLAASLSRGHSGVRPDVIEQILAVLEHDIVPLVPSRGSVGASGDLAPLAHAALVLVGEGEAMCAEDGPMPGSEALMRSGLSPIRLEAKEGLALINGTHLMASTLALACHDGRRLLDSAVIGAAMSLDASRGSAGPYDERLHRARAQDGQIEVARRLRAALDGSTILPDHAQDDPRVQDPYSLRCTPQVLGAALDALAQVQRVVEAELAAVTDNPLVFADDADIVSGGNFHGMPLAIAADCAAIALCHVAGIAERRVFWLLSACDVENPVPPFLSPVPGLHSGLMIAQYTAAACCNEIQTLCVPASVANIPTSAGIEDYNSMGATAASQLRRVVELVAHVVAIEFYVAAEGLEHQRPLVSGDLVEAASAEIRMVVPRLSGDRPPSPDIEAIAGMVLDGRLAPTC